MLEALDDDVKAVIRDDREEELSELLVVVRLLRLRTLGEERVVRRLCVCVKKTKYQGTPATLVLALLLASGLAFSVTDLRNAVGSSMWHDGVVRAASPTEKDLEALGSVIELSDDERDIAMQHGMPQLAMALNMRQFQ